MGWSRLTNGNLLREAETSFDAFITTDPSLQHQQKFSGRRLAILAPDDELVETPTSSSGDRRCD
jgi:hypothetical protein